MSQFTEMEETRNMKTDGWPGTHFYYWCTEHYRKTHKRTHSHRHSKGVPSITALHLLSGHVAPSAFPRTDGFCRLCGHGTTTTSRRTWQHRTNSLTKAASTTHLHSAWHTLMCECVCVHEVCPVFPVAFSLDENTGDKFSSATQVCFWAQSEVSSSRGYSIRQNTTWTFIGTLFNLLRTIST